MGSFETVHHQSTNTGAAIILGWSVILIHLPDKTQNWLQYTNYTFTFIIRGITRPCYLCLIYLLKIQVPTHKFLSSI